MKRRDNVFTQVFSPPIEQSKFDLSHEKKLTFSMGEIVPVCCMEAVPGDSFNLSYMNFLRFMPLIAPVMHRIRVKTEYFFVPNRILFDGWEEFITGTGVVEAPTIRLTGVVDEGSPADYLGIPPGDYSETPLYVSAYQFAAYQLIWDSWYRDQNLQAEISQVGGLQPGNNPALLSGFTGSTNMLRRAWEHDRFTSALPFSQQGTEVDLPLTFQNDIPVEFMPTPGATPNWEIPATGGDPGVGVIEVAAGGNVIRNNGVSDAVVAYDPQGTLTVDVQSEAASINDLREAFSLQAFLERSIRGGQRYFEQMWSHFNQKSPDARLQRPEMIGSNVQMMTISEVLATAQDTAGGIAVGSMAGHGISVGGKERMSYHCEEHGFIMGFISVIPDTAYQDGIHKSFFREDRLDYLWPSFAHLGEQPILGKELLSHDIPAADAAYLESVFGYTPMYSDYRFMNSAVAGAFRSTLAFWTLGRIFTAASLPELNDEFITADPRTDIFADTDETDDHIVCQVINQHTVVRKLPRHGVPSTLG